MIGRIATFLTELVNRHADTIRPVLLPTMNWAAPATIEFETDDGRLLWVSLDQVSHLSSDPAPLGLEPEKKAGDPEDRQARLHLKNGDEVRLADKYGMIKRNVSGLRARMLAALEPMFGAPRNE